MNFFPDVLNKLEKITVEYMGKKLKFIFNMIHLVEFHHLSNLCIIYPYIIILNQKTLNAPMLMTTPLLDLVKQTKTGNRFSVGML